MVKPFLLQHPGAVEQFDLRPCRAAGKQDRFFRNCITHGEHGFQDGFIVIVADTAHFAGGDHLHPQHRVGFLQAGKGELRGFHPDIIQVEERFVRLLQPASRA